MKKRLTLITLCIVMVLTAFNNVWGADTQNRKDDRSSVVAVKPNPLSKKQAVELDSTTESSSTEVRGNSVGNIVNDGYAAIQDDWIYYINISDNSPSLYKIKTDGTGREKV